MASIQGYHYEECMFEVSLLLWKERFGLYVVHVRHNAWTRYFRLLSLWRFSALSCVKHSYWKVGRPGFYCVLKSTLSGCYRVWLHASVGLCRSFILDLFRDVNELFNVTKESELDGRTQVAFFQTFFQTNRRQEALVATASEELIVKKFFNHFVDAMDGQRPQNITSEIFNHETICNGKNDEPVAGSFQMFSDLHLGKLCGLLGLSSLSEELFPFPISGALF